MILPARAGTMRAFQLVDLLRNPYAYHYAARRQPEEIRRPVTVAEVAASIGAGLAKAALAGRVDDKLVDTSFMIEETRSSPSSPRRIRRRST